MINFLYDFCSSYMRPIANLIEIVVGFIKFGIPVALLIFGMLDLGKAVMAGKEDEMKKAQGTLIKRVIYAVLVFLVVWIVQLVMQVVSDTGAGVETGWYDCIFNNDSSDTDVPAEHNR